MFQADNRIRFWEENFAENEVVIANINKLFRQYQVPQINRVEELFQGDINIYPSIPELDPSDGQDIIYTGPIIWDGYNRDLNYEKRQQRQSSDQKIVTVYTGRMSDLGGGNSGIIIFRMLMKVFRNFDCLVRLTTGG